MSTFSTTRVKQFYELLEQFTRVSNERSALSKKTDEGAPVDGFGSTMQQLDSEQCNYGTATAAQLTDSKVDQDSGSFTFSTAQDLLVLDAETAAGRVIDGIFASTPLDAWDEAPDAIIQTARKVANFTCLLFPHLDDDDDCGPLVDALTRRLQHAILQHNKALVYREILTRQVIAPRDEQGFSFEETAPHRYRVTESDDIEDIYEREVFVDADAVMKYLATTEGLGEVLRSFAMGRDFEEISDDVVLLVDLHFGRVIRVHQLPGVFSDDLVSSIMQALIWHLAYPANEG